MRRVLERHWRFSSIDLPEVDPDEVWKAVVPVDLAHLLDPTVVAAWQEGDVQVFVHELDGRREMRRVKVTEVDLEQYLQRARMLLVPSAEEAMPPSTPGVATKHAALQTRTVGGVAAGWYGPAEHASRSVLLHGVTPQQVWDVTRPAEAGTYDPEVVRAYGRTGNGARRRGGPGLRPPRRAGGAQPGRGRAGALPRAHAEPGEWPRPRHHLPAGAAPPRHPVDDDGCGPATSVVVDLGRQHRRHTEAFFGRVRAELRRRSG